MVHYTVLLPARNATGAVARVVRQVRDVLDRLILPYEIICVDDASAPHQAADLEELLADHPPLRVLRFDQPRGTSAALSAGIAASRGELVIGICPETRVPLHYLPHLISRLSRHDLVVAEPERTLGASLRAGLANLPGLLVASPERRGAEEVFFAARREAVTGLALARGTFRVLPALVARRGFRVCRLTIAAGLPPRGTHFRPGMVKRLAVGWLDRRFEPHLARELTIVDGPRPLRGNVARPRYVPQPAAVPVEPKHGKPA